jgi:hypothetical protein
MTTGSGEVEDCGDEVDDCGGKEGSDMILARVAL